MVVTDGKSLFLTQISQIKEQKINKDIEKLNISKIIFFYDTAILKKEEIAMAIFLSESSDLKIMDHINKGDLVVCITAFRGVHNTLKDDPGFLSRLFGRKYPGGEWFDKDDRLHLPDAYDKPDYYQQIKQKVAHLNNQRNYDLKAEWLRKFQYSYVLLLCLDAVQLPRRYVGILPPAMSQKFG